MQPFDDKAFEPYKQFWKRKEYVVPPVDVDDEKTDFIEKFIPVRGEVMKSQAIMEAFAKKGIFPFNPSIVTKPLE